MLWGSLPLKVYQAHLLTFSGALGPEQFPTLLWFLLFILSGSIQKSLSAFFFFCKKTVEISSWGRWSYSVFDCYGWVLESSIPWNVWLIGSCTWPDFQIESQTIPSPGDLPFKLHSRQASNDTHPDAGSPERIFPFRSWTKLHKCTRGRTGKRLSWNDCLQLEY